MDSFEKYELPNLTKRWVVYTVSGRSYFSFHSRLIIAAAADRQNRGKNRVLSPRGLVYPGRCLQPLRYKYFQKQINSHSDWSLQLYNKSENIFLPFAYARKKKKLVLPSRKRRGKNWKLRKTSGCAAEWMWKNFLGSTLKAFVEEKLPVNIAQPRDAAVHAHLLLLQYFLPKDNLTKHVNESHAQGAVKEPSNF